MDDEYWQLMEIMEQELGYTVHAMAVYLQTQDPIVALHQIMMELLVVVAFVEMGDEVVDYSNPFLVEDNIVAEDIGY